MAFDRRPDGWPLCPGCGEDELWSPLLWDGQGFRPPVAAYEAAGLRCYLCGWKSTEAALIDEEVERVVANARERGIKHPHVFVLSWVCDAYPSLVTKLNAAGVQVAVISPTPMGPTSPA